MKVDWSWYRLSDLVDEAELGVLGGDESAGLREDGYQGVLAQVGAFAGHVGACDEVEAFFVVVADEAVVGGEVPALGSEADVDGWVAAADDAVGCAGVEDWAGQVAFFGYCGVGGGDVEFVEDGGVAAEAHEVF
jgi:hypothetical protein